jgi:small nuclear ribonucleoprotein (snRNP)-like protein
MAKKTEPSPELKALLGQQVVVDTDSVYVYLGTLASVGGDYLELADVDVHDTSDTKSTKEYYVHEIRKLGVKKNRQKTLLRLARVLSISKLDDVIVF